MNPVVPRPLWTRPTVMSSVAPYHRSGLIENGLNTAPLFRLAAMYASSSSRPLGSVSWSAPSAPAGAASLGLASVSGSGCACTRPAHNTPSTTHAIVDVLASITVRWNIAHVFSCLCQARQMCRLCAVSRRPGVPLPDRLGQVFVALEPAVQRVGDDVGGMGKIPGHQLVHRGQRSIDRGTAQDFVGTAVRERVLELGLAREHARGERLTARGVGRVFHLPFRDGAHDCSSDQLADGVVVHSRIAWSPGRSTWTLSSTEVTQVSGM